MASSPITSWQIDGETVGTVTGFIFLGSKITLDGDSFHEDTCFLKESYDQHRQNLIKQRYYFADKGLSSQSCFFSR